MPRPLQVLLVALAAAVLIGVSLDPTLRRPNRASSPAPDSRPGPHPTPTPQVAPTARSVPPSPSRASSVSSAVRADALAKISAFDHWLATTLVSGASSAPDLGVGLALAKERRSGLKTLIPVDPREALAHSLPLSARRALPPEIAAQLETRIDAFGTLDVVEICDEHQPHVDRWTTIGSKHFATYTFGERLETLSKNRLPVHGIAIDDVLALSDRPYRGLEPAELPAGGAAAPLLVAVGDGRRAFSTPAELDAWTEGVATAERIPNPDVTEAGANAAAVTTAWTTGEKSVLWIRAEFPDDPGSPATDDDITAAMSAANALYQDVSHNVCSLKATTLPGTVKLTTPKSTYEADPSTYLTLRNDALQLARAYDAANGGTGKYNPDTYDRHIVVFKKVVAYSWAGIASVGSKGLSLNGTAAGAVAAHELGHNHGLRHSHAWAPNTSSPIGDGTHLEYGDAFDDMGSGQNGNYGGHFNTVQKFNLGYLGTESIQTVTTSGRYRVYRHDVRDASGIQALKVATAYTGVNYWFEYRRSPFPVTNRQLNRLQNGVVVHWDKAPSFATGVGTYLLDMTPTTTSGVSPPADSAGITHLLDDAALGLGETFTDSTARMSLTPLAIGGTSPNEWVDVYIALGAQTTNRAPSVSLTTAPTTANARSDITYSASGSDPDGDTVYYHWDFGDGTLAPTTATVTHRWLTGGTYKVQCTAIDGRGGATSTSSNVTVNDPLLTWQRRASTLTSFFFFDVLFDGSQFVAVGTFISATSPDGVNWTLGTGMTSHNYAYALAYGNGRYVAVGAPSGVTTTAASIATSTNGRNWVDQTPPAAASELIDIVFGGDRFVAVGDHGTILTSTDGLTWTVVPLTNTNDLKTVRYGGGTFVAAGTNGTLLTSTDGVQWRDGSVAASTGTIYALAYYQNAWIAVTNSYLPSMPDQRLSYLSADAQTWLPAYTDVNVSLFGPFVVANSSMLIGVSRSNDGRILFAESASGDWAEAAVFPPSAVGTATNLHAVAEGNGTIVVVGSSGQLYSPSGSPLTSNTASTQSLWLGQSATLSAGGYASGPFTYQWKKDGVAINGATNATYTVAANQLADAGTYTAVLTNANGTVTTPGAVVVVNDPGPTINPGRLTNLSIRSTAGTGDQTLIVGVNVNGGAAGATKPVLVRAVGPGLATFGVSGVLADPVLSLYKLGDPTLVASNGGWHGDEQITNVGNSVGAFPLAASSADAALYRQLDRTAYTMQVTGKSGTGVALVEVYDATPSVAFTATTPRLTNVSARTQVGTGDGVLITGFAIGGSTSKRLLIRAVGPTLGVYGVGGTLADPKLEIWKDGVKIKENDDWGGATDLATASASVGAFELKSNKDAVLVLDLQPGSYSAIVRGVNDTTGVALVEVYELP